METDKPLLLGDSRAALMRYDTAVILRRFYFIEKSLLIFQAGWIPAIAPVLLKTTLARMMWEDSLTAEAMRQRIFELRYPSRLLSQEGEKPLIQFVQEAGNAPNALAFFLSLLDVFKPALRNAYEMYLRQADAVGDGPSRRFMNLAHQEVERQVNDLESFRSAMLEVEQANVREAAEWVAELKTRLAELGGVGLDPVEATSGPVAPIPNRKPFQVAQIPARDAEFRRVRFYWPDTCIPGYPYGEGLGLQLRSAISHLNEIWAVEACAAFTYAFADILGWEFVLDAARWTYDESRHCRMGYERLTSWGFRKEDIPLGTYIYDAARDQDPIYRLGMLFFFETKNIHKKTERAQKFHEYQDRLSEHDMDFDWADETKHAHFGNLWLTRLLEIRGGAGDPKSVRQKCEELIQVIVNSASDEERRQIVQIADHLTADAQKIVSDKPGRS
jgi:Protein of unknown function (DUF455)